MTSWRMRSLECTQAEPMEEAMDTVLRCCCCSSSPIPLILRETHGPTQQWPSALPPCLTPTPRQRHPRRRRRQHHSCCSHRQLRRHLPLHRRHLGRHQRDESKRSSNADAHHHYNYFPTAAHISAWRLSPAIAAGKARAFYSCCSSFFESADGD